MSSDDTEYSSETNATDVNSTYIPSDDLVVDPTHTDIPSDQHDLTEINSEDFLFNIANAYGSEVDQVHAVQNDDAIIHNDDINNVEEIQSNTSSMFDLDIPIVDFIILVKVWNIYLSIYTYIHTYIHMHIYICTFTKYQKSGFLCTTIILRIPNSFWKMRECTNIIKRY